MYCVLMADIIHSKEREESTIGLDHIEITNILEEVNNDYHAVIFSPLTIVRGDAIEGVLYSKYYALDILERIIRNLFIQRGIRIRACAVEGELTLLDSDNNVCNGPAFHKAAKELEKLKERNSDHWYQISLCPQNASRILLDGMMRLLSELTATWTDKQRIIVWSKLYNDVQVCISNMWKVSPPVISKQLKAAKYKEYKYAVDSIRDYFAQIEEEAVINGTADYLTYYCVGRRLVKKLEYKEAMVYFDKAYAMCKGLDIYSKRLIPLYNGIAECLIEMSEEEETEEIRYFYISEASKKIEETLSALEERKKEDFDYIQTLILKANLLLAKKEYEEAIAIFQRAYEMALSRFGKNNALVDACITGAANCYKNRGDYSKAEEYYRKSLEYAEMSRQIDPIGYADSLYNLVAVQLLENDRKCEIDKLEDAIVIYGNYLKKDNRVYLDAVEMRDDYLRKIAEG